MSGGTVACCVIIFLVLGGTAVLIAWSVDKIKSPTFFIDQGTITGYNFTNDNRLNATFTVVIRSHNRDSKYTILYNSVLVGVFHDGLSLAYVTLGPYTQQHGDDIVFTAHPVARNFLVSDIDAARSLRNEIVSGQLNLEVRIRATVKFEVKRWKHKRYALGISCSTVAINLASGRTFQGTNCHVDRF